MPLRQQAIRFIVVGVSWNAAFYLIFVLLTSALDSEPKATMSALYFAGIAVSFLANRRITFRHKGAIEKSAPKFVALYMIGYLANLAGLWALVDRFHWPSWVAQGLLARLLAVFFFAAQRSWVFSSPAEENRSI